MSKEKFESVASKISPEAMTLLNAIANRMGLTKYELIQMVIDTIIRYLDDRHNLSPEMERAMAVFEHLSGWSGAMNLTDPTGRKEIGEAIYFLSDPKGLKQGCRAVSVSRPMFGDWQATYNVQQIFESVVCMLFPERYRRMRQMAVDRGCTSLLQMLDVMLDDAAKAEDLAELRRPFADAMRTDSGRQMADAPYRRKHHRGMEHIDGQTRTMFDELEEVAGSIPDDDTNTDEDDEAYANADDYLPF